jgi:hypothetical protein
MMRLVPAFHLQFAPSEIAGLASRFSYEDDAACRAAGATARTRGHYTRDEFLAVCLWKTARSRSKVAANDAETVEHTTGQAFSSSEEAVRIEVLTSLRGVGIPTASALLHFAFPDDYPILDVRALASLGRRGRTVYPVSFWLEYLSACRALAREHGVSIRTLDKALWQHSKERGVAGSRIAGGERHSTGPRQDAETAAQSTNDQRTAAVTTDTAPIRLKPYGARWLADKEKGGIASEQYVYDGRYLETRTIDEEAPKYRLWTITVRDRQTGAEVTVNGPKQREATAAALRQIGRS